MKQSKFKETEIGEIPEGWGMVSFKGASIDIIDGDRGKNYPKKNEFKQEGFCLFLNTKNVPHYSFDFSECNFIDNGRDSLLGKGKLERGDLVLTTRGTVGNVAHYHNDIDFTNIRVNSGMVILRNQEQEFDTRFLYLLLRSPIMKNQIMSFATGSAQPQLPIRDINKIKLPTPSLDEQKAIAKILSDLDSKIELNNEMNKTLESIGQVLFKHWFVDFDFPNEEGKPYKSSGGEMVESELGRIPKRWRVNVFSEVVGVNPKRSLPKGVLAKKISMADLIPWQSWIVHYEIVNYDSGPKFIGGDTLLARITPSLEHGKTAIVSLLEEGEVGFGSTEFIVMAPQEITSCYYIFYLARSREVRDFAIGSMTGTSGRQRVPSDCFDYLKIIVPPEDLIQRYHNIATPIFDEITANSLQNRELESIRDSLLSRLMSGKIRVN